MKALSFTTLLFCSIFTHAFIGHQSNHNIFNPKISKPKPIAPYSTKKERDESFQHPKLHKRMKKAMSLSFILITQLIKPNKAIASPKILPLVHSNEESIVQPVKYTKKAKQPIIETTTKKTLTKSQQVTIGLLGGTVAGVILGGNQVIIQRKKKDVEGNQMLFEDIISSTPTKDETDGYDALLEHIKESNDVMNEEIQEKSKMQVKDINQIASSFTSLKEATSVDEVIEEEGIDLSAIDDDKEEEIKSIDTDEEEIETVTDVVLEDDFIGTSDIEIQSTNGNVMEVSNVDNTVSEQMEEIIIDEPIESILDNNIKEIIEEEEESIVMEKETTLKDDGIEETIAEEIISEDVDIIEEKEVVLEADGEEMKVEDIISEDDSIADVEDTIAEEIISEDATIKEKEIALEIEKEEETKVEDINSKDDSIADVEETIDEIISEEVDIIEEKEVISEAEEIINKNAKAEEVPKEAIVETTMEEEDDDELGLDIIRDDFEDEDIIMETSTLVDEVTANEDGILKEIDQVIAQQKEEIDEVIEEETVVAIVEDETKEEIDEVIEEVIEEETIAAIAEDEIKEEIDQVLAKEESIVEEIAKNLEEENIYFQTESTPNLNKSTAVPLTEEEKKNEELIVEEIAKNLKMQQEELKEKYDGDENTNIYFVTD